MLLLLLLLLDSAAAAEEDDESLLAPAGASSAPLLAAVVVAAAAVASLPCVEGLMETAAVDEGRPQTTRREVLSSACCRGLAAEVLADAVARQEAVVASRQSISLCFSASSSYGMCSVVLPAQPAVELRDHI